jgi:hypothetical protein
MDFNRWQLGFELGLMNGYRIRSHSALSVLGLIMMRYLPSVVSV